jgi:type IV pilus assembly protein PilM
MASARFAWGIDIGNRALKAIKLVRSETGLRIDDFEVIEHENVLSNAGDNKEALIQSALANFVERHPAKGGVAAISVSGVSSFARFIKLPPVEDKKIPEIVKFEAIQQIPFPLDDVEWSYQLFRNPDSPEVEVGIFAMRRDLLNQQIQHFTNVNLNVQLVQMNPLAVYNAMYYDNRIQGTTLIVDLGAENTDLIIAEGEGVWLRSIPIGGNNFTEVLVKSFKLPFGKAEELKRNANTSKYARQIFQAMRPVFADLVAEIQRSIGFYSSVHRDSRIKKVLALGGTFRLAGLQKYLQQNLQLDVEKLNEMSAGAPADAKQAATFNQNLLSLVSAYGLAIQAMGEGKIQSSLLPRQIRRERMWKDKTKWFGAAAAAFVLATGVAVGEYYYQDLQYKQAASDRQRIDDDLTQGRSLVSRWQSGVETGGAADQQNIKNIRAMFDGRYLWPAVLEDVLGALPQANSPPPPVPNPIPRQQRNQIVIDNLSCVYAPDLAKSMTSGQLGLTIPVSATPDPAIPVGSRGFIVTANVTTPHVDGSVYVLTNFVAKLRQLDQAAMDKYNSTNPAVPKAFYIAKVFEPVGQIQLKDDPIRKQFLEQSYSASITPIGAPPGNGAPAMSGGNNSGEDQGDTGDQAPVYNRTAPAAAPAPGTPGAPAHDPAFTDRLTGEDREFDWEMKIVFIVVLPDPKPVTPAS